MAKNLVEDWSPDAYIALGQAAIADAFKVYVKALKTIYAIEHPEDTHPLVKKERASLLKRVESFKRRAVGDTYRGTPISLDLFYKDAQAKAGEIQWFLHQGSYSCYTSLEPSVFERAARIKLDAWKRDDGRSAGKPTLFLSHFAEK